MNADRPPSQDYKRVSVDNSPRYRGGDRVDGGNLGMATYGGFGGNHSAGADVRHTMNDYYQHTPPPPPPPVPVEQRLPVPDPGVPRRAMPSTKRPKILNRRPTTTLKNLQDWGERAVDMFQIISLVGEGTFGQVYKAEEKETGAFSREFITVRNQALMFVDLIFQARWSR
jgi:hypothetical protein